MRKPIIAGNWKMNKLRDEALKFVYDINNELPSIEKLDVVLFAQSIHLRCMVKRQGCNLRIGSQNVHYEEKGAYTGELSAAAIKDVGVEYVLIGHSERRQMFNETDESINKKIKISLKHNLKVILCIGETLLERKNNETKIVLMKQLIGALDGVTAEELENIVIAYEPIWAIGTGESASPELAEATCLDIREIIKTIYDESIANSLRIQYGGSVDQDNFLKIISQENIDGVLIGSTSLDSSKFLDIINQL